MSLLEFPKEISLIDLPSKGLFYDVDHPLHKQKCIEIYHMRGAEENILTNKDYLKKEVAIDKLLQALFVDEELKKDKWYSKLLVVDQAALILNARIAAYSPDYEVSVLCPKCKEIVKYNFNLSDYKVIDPDYENDSNILYNEKDNTFTLKLPKTPIEIKITSQTIGVQRKVKNKILAKKKDKSLTNKEQYEDLIVSINNISDPKIVETFFEEAPKHLLNWFYAVVEDVNPSLSLEQNFKCSNCDHEQDIEPPFTSDFLFTAKIRRKKTNTKE